MIDLAALTQDQLEGLRLQVRQEIMMRSGRQRTCVRCKAKFTGRSDATYCSTKCRVSGHREARRIQHESESAQMQLMKLPTRRLGKPSSPLRYPGGKAVLAGFFSEVIEKLGLEQPTYVEPFAGGVGAGIELLINEQVGGLIINDIDAAVFAFWKTAVEQTDEFIERLLEAPLTIEEWDKQKSIYRARDERDMLSLGFAFFYLNRTNRSGILNAGVIGGRNQTGAYLMDARFNRGQLAQRLSALGALRDKIEVKDDDGKQVISRYAHDPNAFVYIDPPYVDMGGSLYLNAFNHRDHADLAAIINSAPDGNWILTYDMSPVVTDAYSERPHWEYELNYSGYKAQKGRELLVASNPVAEVLRSINLAKVG